MFSDDADNDGEGAEADGNNAPLHRMQTSMISIQEYAKSDRLATLVLPAGHTFRERETLHRVASKFGLVSRSVGEEANRCLHISRHTAYVPLATSIGHQALEYLVAKPSGTRSRRLIRGFVLKFDARAERWTLLFEDGSVDVVDLAALNTHIKCHHDSLVALMGGTAETADPRLSTRKEGDELLKSMLDGVKEGWEKDKLKYDPRHWMCCFMSVCQGDPASPLYKQCLHDLSEALFDHNVQDRLALQEYLRDVRGMSPEQIKALPPSWFHKHERRYIQSPHKIIPRLTDWYLFYKDLPDPAKGGRPRTYSRPRS